MTTWIKHEDEANLLEIEKERKKEPESSMAQALNCLSVEFWSCEPNTPLLLPLLDGFSVIATKHVPLKMAMYIL